MAPTKSKGNKSRRSSILKPRKPRQPLQNVNFSSSSNENSPVTSKLKRRVSFAEKKHVKEFSHSTEQGTVWDNTYEEHDSSLKRSFDIGQDTSTKSKENASQYNEMDENICTRIVIETSSHCTNRSYIADQPCRSTTELGDNADNDLNTVEYADLFDKRFPLKQTTMLDVPKSAMSTINVYRDEEECANNITAKYYSESNNVNSELDKTCIQDLSMEFTTAIPASLLSLHLTAEENKQNNVQRDGNISHRDNINIDYTTNSNNLSMEMTRAIPTIVKMTTFDLKHCNQVPVIVAQNWENVKCNASSNAFDNTMISSTSLQPTKSIVPEQIQDHGDNSMELTTIVQSFIADKSECHTSNKNNLAFNTLMEITTAVPSKTYERDILCLNNEDIIGESNPRKHQKFFEITDKTEYFNDILMEMTNPINIILPSSVYDKENLRVDVPISNDDKNMLFHNASTEMTKTMSSRNKPEIDSTTSKSLFEEIMHTEKNPRQDVSISKDDRTMLYHDASMEMTKTVSSKNKLEIIDSTTSKSFEEIMHIEKNPRQDVPISKDDRTMLFHNASMEMTNIVSSRNKPEIDSTTSKSLFEEITHTEKNPREDVPISKDDRTMLFHNASMEMTKTVSSRNKSEIDSTTSKSLFEEITHTEKNPREDVPISKDDRTMLFHNASMEMTKTVSSRNKPEIIDSIIFKSFEENMHTEKNMNKSVFFNERTELHKSMDFIEAAYVSSHHKKTYNIAHTVESEISSCIIPRIHLSTIDSAVSVLQTDVTANNTNTIQDISMEMTATVPSTCCLTQNTTINEKSENLIVPQNNASQCLPASNITDSEYSAGSKKNVTENNFTITREVTQNIHNELFNTHVIQSLTDNLDHSLNATLMQNSDKKGVPHENENIYLKEVRNSHTGSQSSIESSMHSSSRAVHNNVTDDMCDEHLVKNTMNSTRVLIRISESNFNDNLNEINEYSFLRKSLPHLENSFVELQSINPPSFICMNSDEENSFPGALHEDKLQTIDATPISDKNCSGRSESINRMENCHRSVIANKIENNREAECQTVIKTIVDDNQINESNCYVIRDIEHFTDGSLMSNINHEKTPSTDHLKKTEVINTDQTNEECIREKINHDMELGDIEKKDSQYSDGKEESKAEQFGDYLKKVEEIIEDRANREKHNRENLNDKVNLQNMNQKERYVEDGFEVEQCISAVENESLIEQDPFLSLSQRLETYAESDNCIWNVYYKNIDRRMIVFGFMSSSLLIAIFFLDNVNCSENIIKEIKIISRLADDAGVLIKIVHGLILEKINAKILMHLYKTHEDVLPMLDFISQDVKLAMDFMFDLKRLDNLNLMDITCDKISFISRSKQMDIILEIMMNVKRFDKLTPNDISIRCLLGTVREADVKNLIKNVKRDHKFLRRYMNDVKDYIDIMEETFND